MCSLTKLNFKYQSRKDSTKTRTILSSTIRIKSSSSTIDDSTAKTTAQEQLESRLLGIKYPEDNLINRIRTNKIQRNSRKSILENFELNNNSYYSNLYYDKNNIYNNGNESSKNCCRAYIKSPTIISAVTTPLKMWNIFLIILIIFLSQRIVLCVDAMHWDHDVQLNEDFRLLWSVTPQDITFEIQVRALGYVGLGFSYDGNIPGADMAIGWVDRGQPYFQDRHVKQNGDVEPQVDPSQDYILKLGYENATHTVFRFKRKYDTCDSVHDIPITNDTMRIIFMYSKSEPWHGAVKAGSLPNPLEAFKESRSLYLTQKFQPRPLQDDRVRMLELRNEDVELPSGDDTLYWCKMFKLDDIKGKHHLIRYEPVIDSANSLQYLQHIMLYECLGSSTDLEQMAREQGRQCYKPYALPLACNAIVAAWSRGSEGFTFPDEAGYPIETRVVKYFLMETHYYNPKPDFAQLHSRQMADNSGLRIYFTHSLRLHDAGVLSIGMDPNWRHIIPPGQKHVVSEGHCIEDCTGYAFPREGINIFAVMMQTHQIGREIKLKQIRRNEELPPIAHDSNIDPNYQDYRRLPSPVHSIPGDRLIAECIYDSSSRKAITLGGLTTREESCVVITLYYPRQKKLTTCHSLPSLPTVLHSLGIEELAMGSNPVLISLPQELAGMTLESRLVSYDWENQFDKFQEVTRRGSFKPLCWGAKNVLVPGTEYLEGYSVNITKAWQPPRRCKPRRVFVTEAIPEVKIPVLHVVEDDVDISNNIIEVAARSKVSRSSATETMSFSSAHRFRYHPISFTHNSCYMCINYLWYYSVTLIVQRILKMSFT